MRDVVVNERPIAPEDVTAAVLASFDACEDERLRELIQSFVRYLHGFASEVKLMLPEWEQAIRILTETGYITDDRRQEFILWSDALGVSMLVDALAVDRPAGATESTVVGPFWARAVMLKNPIDARSVASPRSVSPFENVC